MQGQIPKKCLDWQGSEYSVDIQSRGCMALTSRGMTRLARIELRHNENCSPGCGTNLGLIAFRA
jgi:hypothetical protein